MSLLSTRHLELVERRDAGGGVTTFAFRPDRPLGALAGQHGFLRLGPTTMKPFSLASAPEEDDVLIGTALASASAFKGRLGDLDVGDTVKWNGPLGSFTLDDGIAQHVVMLAQGVGVTPLRAMLAHLEHTDAQPATTLVHVARPGHAYRSETEQWAGDAVYVDGAESFRQAAARAAREHSGALFLLAGATAFVNSTASLLKESGVPKGQLRLDKYLGYRPRVDQAAR